MAAKSSPPPPDRVAQSLKELSAVAARLNAASDEFSKATAPIDAALKKLNLGVEAWHRYAGWGPDQDGDYSERRIGYAKVAGKWGLALATASGSTYSPDEYGEQWLFNDAPRSMRIEAVEHVPALLEELVKRADQLATDLQEKTFAARELATTIASLVPDGQSRR